MQYRSECWIRISDLLNLVALLAEECFDYRGVLNLARANSDEVRMSFTIKTAQSKVPGAWALGDQAIRCIVTLQAIGCLKQRNLPNDWAPDVLSGLLLLGRES